MENISPAKKRLKKAARELFAKYGFAATSVRMIAKAANVNISAISEHFGGKQQLYDACIDSSVRMLHRYYDEYYSELDKVIEAGELTVDAAEKFLVDAIDRQIEVAFKEEYDTTMGLIYAESNYNVGAEDTRLSDAIFNLHEKRMAQLILRIVPITEEKAILASRYINGAIIAFGEHRTVYMKYLEQHISDKSLDARCVRQMIRAFSMSVLETLKENPGYEFE